MYIPFDQIDFEARVWVYQCDRNLTNEEVGTITETMNAALEGWGAHGHPLVASSKVFLNRFVVVAVNDGQTLPSGCSIDQCVHWLQEIGLQLHVDFMDRAAIYVDDSGKLQSVAIADVKAAIASNEIMSDTTVFDNLVDTKAKWMSRWKIRARDSWMKRFFVEEDAK